MRQLIWIGILLASAGSVGNLGAQSTNQLWHYYSAGSELAGINALIDYANKRNPDAPIGGRIIPGNVVEMRRQLETAFLGGKPPALYQSSMAFELKTFVDGGRLHSLADVWNTIRGDDIFPKGVQRVVKVGGVPYGVPYDFSVINDVFYNKALFAKLGLTAPSDWDGFVADCDALRKAGIQPLGDAGGPFWSLYNFYAPLVSVVGVEGYYKIADGELGFDTPEFRKALDLYRTNMIKNYAKNWSGKTWTQAADDVVNGNTGMLMMGIWASAYFKQAGFEPGKQFDVFPAPGTDGKVIFQMDVFAVPQGPEASVKAAEKFIVAAASVKGQETFAVPKGSLAPNVNVDPTVYDYAGSKFAQQLVAASKANAVLPNLFFLLPTNVGTELGNQIERFAIDSSEDSEKELVSTMEALRQEALSNHAYIKW